MLVFHLPISRFPSYGIHATANGRTRGGLRLPPVKLVRRGEISQDNIDIVLNNIRVAEELRRVIRAARTHVASPVCGRSASSRVT
jgi:N-methylhydantoinase B/oxoprolinase/acetone carboxylase alpha subunit